MALPQEARRAPPGFGSRRGATAGGAHTVTSAAFAIRTECCGKGHLVGGVQGPRWSRWLSELREHLLNQRQKSPNTEPVEPSRKGTGPATRTRTTKLMEPKKRGHNNGSHSIIHQAANIQKQPSPQQKTQNNVGPVEIIPVRIG